MYKIAICRQCILSIKKVLITQFTRINYHCNVNFRTFKVSNYFSLRDVTPLTLGANVVYCLKGSCDKTQYYIGKIKRHMVVKVQERFSGKSGKSAIHEHINSCKGCHSCSISNFYILDPCPSIFSCPPPTFTIYM